MIYNNQIPENPVGKHIMVTGTNKVPGRYFTIPVEFKCFKIKSYNSSNNTVIIKRNGVSTILNLNVQSYCIADTAEELIPKIEAMRILK